jgi:hypothetical protein
VLPHGHTGTQHLTTFPHFPPPPLPPSLRQKLELHERGRKRLSKNTLKILEEACELRCDMVRTGCDPRSLYPVIPVIAARENDQLFNRCNIFITFPMSHIPQIPKAVTIDTSKVSGKIDLPRVVQQLKKRGFHALRQGANHCFAMMKIIVLSTPSFFTNCYRSARRSARIGHWKGPGGPEGRERTARRTGHCFWPGCASATVRVDSFGQDGSRLHWYDVGAFWNMDVGRGIKNISKLPLPSSPPPPPPPLPLPHKYKGGTRMEVPWSLMITAVTFWAWTAGQRTGPS